MMLRVDLHGVEEKATDLRVLQAYLQQLIGQPFLHFRFSYGDELSLHFGQPRPYESPRMKHLFKGSYILGTRASRWYLRSESHAAVVIGSDEFLPPQASTLRVLTKQELESGELVQRGARIVVASGIPLAGASPGTALSSYGLTLSLSDGSSLVIAPEAAASVAPEEEASADWELFTPYERYLRVGPGLQWSYLPSRQPALPPTAELAHK